MAIQEQLQRAKYPMIYLKHKLFPRQSYAQHGEDLTTLKLIGDVETFIDIGANDGISVSNTFLFALKGARGLCIEPVPSTFRLLSSLYLFNNKITCLNYGVSDTNKKTEIVSSGLLSYLPETQDDKLQQLLSNYFPEQKKVENVELVPFDKIIKYTNFPNEIDLLSIDVEGHELNVVKSIDFARYHFQLIVIETHSKNRSGNLMWEHQKIKEIETVLSRFGYKKVNESNTNSFYHKS